MYCWRIIRGKKKLPLAIQILESEWHQLVEEDPSLTWFDDTEFGINYYNGDGKSEPRRRTAYYEYDSIKKRQIMLFQWIEFGYIIANGAPKTQKKLQKVFEIASKLDAKVYKGNKEIVQ